MLPTGKGGPAHKTNWEAVPPYRKKEMLDAQNDDNLVKIDFSEPFSKNSHNKDEKVTYKRTNWAIAHNQGNIDDFEIET